MPYSSWFELFVQGTIAFGILFNAGIALLTRIEAKRTRRATEVLGQDMRTLELSTNGHMKALLVAKQSEADARVEAASVTGQKTGREEEAARQKEGT